MRGETTLDNDLGGALRVGTDVDIELGNILEIGKELDMDLDEAPRLGTVVGTELGRYKCDTDLMILLKIIFLLEYRLSLINVTLNLFFSLVRSVVLPLLLLLTPILIYPLKMIQRSAKTMMLL